MVDDLKKLRKDVEKAIGRVGAEYSYAKALLEKLEEAEREEPKPALKDMKKAMNLFKWLGRGEQEINKSEERIIRKLKDLGEILPEETKSYEEKILEQLEVVHAKLVRSFSRYMGDLRNELNEIRTEEALLKRAEDNEGLKVKLASTFRNVKNEIKELEAWVQSTEAVLRNIQGFEEMLEKSSAEA